MTIRLPFPDAIPALVNAGSELREILAFMFRVGRKINNTVSPEKSMASIGVAALKGIKLAGFVGQYFS